MQIELPISKSIANRLLILQAIHGDGLLTVSDCYSLPDDVRIMSEAIRQLGEKREARIDIGNCGTAMRFLTAYCAQLDGTTVILDGVERMRHRPIGQLVDALREIGAQIDYLGEEGYPPLRIKGCILDKQRLVTINNPQSTQFVSALLLIGANVHTDSTSPYITLTRILIENYLQRSDLQGIDARSTAQRSAVSAANELERDWSSAAFWYEYVALHGGEITLPGLYRDSLQGDKVVADIFTRLGVQTTYTAEGITIVSTGVADLQRSDLQGIDVRSTAQRSAEEILLQDFSACPDLYPAVALTCERLGIELHATGTDSLPLKESDRLRAVREHRTDHDHRMAMALLIAGYEVDDTICISKSYPQFIEQWNNVIRSHA
jgi:3-phosphoshikimate 1-carboxyvinyltransferase